jgi:hypothetical protein
MIERTTVRLPRELLGRAKRKALAEHRTLTSLIEEGLRLVLGENQRVNKAKRVISRACSATGGTFPGIDISNSAALQEMDDLEYVERMKYFK